MTKFTFHSDDGHGWLQVTPADIASVGLKVSDFTRYSYRKDDALYLEEDCDASKFAQAFEAKHGAPVPHETRHYRGSAPIRNYARLEA